MTTRLIKAVLIEEARDPDSARGNLLTLSARGRETLASVYDLWTDMDRMIEDLLGQAKAHSLAALTREPRDALGSLPPGPPVD
jgi:DNA-binding MarR family transcriptional regulator